MVLLKIRSHGKFYPSLGISHNLLMGLGVSDFVSAGHIQAFAKFLSSHYTFSPQVRILKCQSHTWSCNDHFFILYYLVDPKGAVSQASECYAKILKPSKSSSSFSPNKCSNCSEWLFDPSVSTLQIRIHKVFNMLFWVLYYKVYFFLSCISWVNFWA